ncbi:hypothetical protein A3B57_03630 [Microgenomates group bacterium RIFCSPLOWO2_01_FULL_47_10]|nr:MAG: hypothetical protein A3B57_03630 [Microgenomates group bacterium RIFCSPLOWO2_01_FULL_47_10]
MYRYIDKSIQIEMTQISTHHLPKSVWQKIWQIFSATIAKSDSSISSLILSGLLTKSEEIMLAKRLVASFMLINHYSYKAISQELKLSTSTIYRIQEILENNPAYHAVLKKLIPSDLNLEKDTAQKPLSFVDRLFLGYRKRYLLRV